MISYLIGWKLENDTLSDWLLGKDIKVAEKKNHLMLLAMWKSLPRNESEQEINSWLFEENYFILDVTAVKPLRSRFLLFCSFLFSARCFVLVVVCSSKSNNQQLHAYKAV